MLLVYIVGPYRAATPWEIERNVRRAEDVAAQVVALGAYPVIPHANTRFFQGLADDDFFLEATQELLLRCDAAMLVPGWQASEGSIGEIELAQAEGVPCFEHLDKLQAWIVGQTIAQGLDVGKEVVFDPWVSDMLARVGSASD
jgi:hypothetical protein